MNLFARLRSWLRALLFRSRIERDMGDELRFHLEERIANLIREGLTQSEARRIAGMEFGAIDASRDECREALGLRLWDDLRGDIRHATRSLRRAPIFASVIIASLALGIGLNTAIFSLLDSIMLKSLPVHEPQRLVVLNDGLRFDFSNPTWEQIRDQQNVFAGAFAWLNEPFSLFGAGESSWVDGMLVSGSFFEVLGIEPIVGRVFTPEDDHRGCGAGTPPAVISYGFWQRQYAGTPDIQGKLISIERHPFTIIGVAPRSFFGLDVGRQVDIIAPICSEAILTYGSSALDARGRAWLNIMARLKPGQTILQAEAGIRALQIPTGDVTPPISVVPAGNGLSTLRQRYSQALYVLMGVAGLVLLVACANVANLLLARAAGRSKEIAVRMSIGASRTRLFRQLLAESILLGLISSAVGVIVAQWASRILVNQIATNFERPVLDLRLDWRILGFTIAIGVLTGVFFGVYPAFRASRHSWGTISMARRVGVSRSFVTIQIALSLVLLIGAALFIRSYYTLSTMDPGFETSKVLLISPDIRQAGMLAPQRFQLYDRLLAGLNAVPGIEVAAYSVLTPIGSAQLIENISLDGSDGATAGDGRIWMNYVSPGYLGAVNTPLIAGRDLNVEDTPSSTKVAIINETAARKLFPGRNPIGLTYRSRLGNGPWYPVEIVGVARDARYRNLRDDVPPTAYVPWRYLTIPLPVTFVARSSIGAAALAPAVTSTFAAINKDVAVRYRTFDSQVRDSLVQERLMSWLGALFGALALTVAAVGVAGLVGYSIDRRRNEIGIRSAIGAGPNSLVWLVLKDVVVSATIGIAIGAAASLVLTRFIASMIFGLTPTDPSTFMIAGGVLAALALFAGYIPARRASGIDPVDCLRSE